MNRWMKIINKFNIIAIYLTSVVNYYFKKGIFQNIKLAWYIFKTNRSVIHHNLLCACAKTTYILLSFIILLFYYIFFIHLIVLNCCSPLFLSIIFLLLTLSRFILLHKCVYKILYCTYCLCSFETALGNNFVNIYFSYKTR